MIIVTSFSHITHPFYPVFPLVLQMISEYERRAKHFEEQIATFSHLEEMKRKVQQLEQELQWALVIEIEKVMPFTELLG